MRVFFRAAVIVTALAIAGVFVGCSGIDKHVEESKQLRGEVLKLQEDLKTLRAKVPELEKVVAGIEAQTNAAASELDAAVQNDPSLVPALSQPRARLSAISDLVLEAKIRFPELAEMIRTAERDAGLAGVRADRVVAGAQQIQRQAQLFNTIPQMLGLTLPSIDLGGVSDGLRQGADLLDAGRRLPEEDPSPDSDPWKLVLGLTGIGGSVLAGGYGVHQAMQGRRRQELATQTNLNLSMPGVGTVQGGFQGNLQLPGVYAAPNPVQLPQAPAPVQTQVGFQANLDPSYMATLPAMYQQPPLPDAHAHAQYQAQVGADRVPTEPVVPADLANAQARAYAQQQGPSQSGVYSLPRQQA